MSAVLTKKRAKAQTSLVVEADQLVRMIAREMSAVLLASESAFENWPVRDQLDRAGCILGRLAKPDIFDPVDGAPDEDTSGMLQAAKEALDLEIVAIQRDAGDSLSGALHDGIVALHIRDRLIEVIDALDAGAEGIDQLRRLATYEGAMGNKTSTVVDRGTGVMDVTDGAALATASPLPEGEKNPSEMLHHAVAVYWSLADYTCRDEAYGLHSIAEHASEEVDAAVAAMDFFRAENASCLLAQVAALSEIVIKADQNDEMPLPPPALSLLKQAKALLDDLIGALGKARRAAHA